MSNRIQEEVKMCELEILKVVAKLAEENNIQYYLMFGSLLGAVRHKGFIPWDDDIDIGLPREDYDRFMKILKEKLPKQYYLQNYNTDKNWWFPFAKVRKCGTIYRELGMEAIPAEKCGIWIDLFPLDTCKKLGVSTKLINYLVERMSDVLIIRMLKWKITFRSRRYRPILRIFLLFSNEKLIRWQEKLMKLQNTKTGKFYISMGLGDIRKQIYEKEYFQNPIKVKFEDLEFFIPSNYDAILKRSYGDYMKIPPVNERIYHNPIEIKF